MYPDAFRQALIVCPQGDGNSLADGSNQILVQLRHNCCCPVEGASPFDFWLLGTNALTLCGGSASANADSATNADGYTTISGTMSAGGSDTGLYVCFMGAILGPCPIVGLPITVVSPDLDADLNVNLTDFALFSFRFPSPPAQYDYSCDYDADGDIDLVDYAIFALHWQHHCMAP
jgi:hypothetical protein